MGVGPDEMVDLEFLKDRTNERSAARAGGIGFLERSERAKNGNECYSGNVSPTAAGKLNRQLGRRAL